MEPKAKVVSLIELTFERGEGPQHRLITQYRTARGRVLWEHDPLHDRARNDSVAISIESEETNGNSNGNGAEQPA